MKKHKEPFFQTIEQMVATVSATVRPPERITVSQAAEKYRYLNNPGSYVGPWSNEKTPYLVEIMDSLTSHDYTGAVFVGPARTGKALAVDTLIPTPDGWTTMGEIQVGDEVFTPFGETCRVMAATEVMLGRPCYEITFSSGEKIVSDAQHQWFVRDVIAEKNKVITTEEMFHSHVRQKRNRFAIENAAPIAGNHKELFIDPYVLGVWLGDGNSRNGYITSYENDAPELLAQLEKRGYSATVYAPRRGTRACTLAIRGPDGVSLENYLTTLKIGGEYGKFIPPEYLRASVHQRTELLRGLCDTDGSLYGKSGRTVQLPSSFPRLAAGILELVRSLGHRPRPRVYQTWYKRAGVRKRCLDSHIVEFTTYEPENVFSLPRKIDVFKRGASIGQRRSHVLSRFVTQIRPVESVPVRCIQVEDLMGLFLCGEGMIPTHNSDIFFNWLGHTAICDPADMMMVHMTQNTARDWSQGDLRKVFRHSPAIGDTVAKGRQNLNVHDIKFTSGMRLLVKWPTISELSGKTVKYVWLNDYDRGDEIIEKEGIKWDLAKKRTTTFRRFAMTVAESSPGRDVSDPQWSPKSPHEAPPTGDDKTPGGILALYNRGDRRRWHWRCPQCASTFEPDFELLEYPDSSDPAECAANVHMICPHDGFPMTPDMQYELNLGGRWVKEGQIWMPDGSMVGPTRQTDIASFWLKGPAAAFTTWNDLVLKYETAKKEFDTNGNEDPLRGTVTLDQGRAYLPKSREAARLPETLKSRAEDWGGTAEAPVVPPGTRFLIATVDVQKTAFVVQVHGFGATGDIWLVDMFRITKSTARVDGDGHPERIDPAGHPEDWQVLVEKVITRTYPLGDGSGRYMMIKLTGCDSGGKEGVTANAYAFYRWLREQGDGHHARFALVKGVDSKATQQRVRLEYPDSGQRGINAVARGDVPVHMLSSNLLKDQASAMLNREKPGTEKVGGMIHFPKWAPEWLYKQLTAEVKTAKGWENKGGRRNESWDLLYYAIGLAIYHPVSWERINWSDPPGWAGEWDENDLVSEDSLTLPFTTHSNGDYDLAKLGEQLA